MSSLVFTKLVFFNFRGENASFPTSFHESQYDGWSSPCQILCRYTQSTLAASCVCWIVLIVTCDTIKRTNGLFMFEMHLITGRTDGWQVCESFRCQAKCKIPALPRLYFGIYILLVSVDCCFFAFFGVFSGDFGFLHRHSIRDLLLFLSYFLSVSQWAPYSLVSPWLKPLVTSLYLIKARLYYRYELCVELAAVPYNKSIVFS